MTLTRPSNTTDAHWRLVTTIMDNTPGAQFAGTWAHKPGYHYSVNGNKAEYHGEYSSVLPDDLNYGNLTVSRATDITMPHDQMLLRTGYLTASAKHPEDDRLNCLREFIGLDKDGEGAFCMIKDGTDGAIHQWRVDMGRDDSHEWHVHKSVFARWINTWDARPGMPGLEGVASVWLGETWENWVLRKAGDDNVYWVIREAGAKKDWCGRTGGGTYQQALTLDEYMSWRNTFPAPEIVITAAQFDSGVLGLDVRSFTGGGSAPSGQVPEHTHQNVTITGGSLTGNTGGVTRGK